MKKYTLFISLFMSFQVLALPNYYANNQLDTNIPMQVQVPQINANAVSGWAVLFQAMSVKGQKKSLEKILAKNTLPNGEIDLISSLEDAKKSTYANENINIISEMIREDNYQKQQKKMLNERIEVENRLKQAEINLQNAKHEEALLAKYSTPPQMSNFNRSSNEEKIYIDHVSNDLYKTDDGRFIKTQSCYEYVYSERALIMNNKLIFKNGKTCDIEKIINM